MTMRIIETCKLTGMALDWTVAQCLGEDYSETRTTNGIGMEFDPTNYSTDWSLAGSIIEDNDISIIRTSDGYAATMGHHAFEFAYSAYEVSDTQSITIERNLLTEGDTQLEAAMRCYVQSLLGDAVYVPQHLTKGK